MTQTQRVKFVESATGTADQKLPCVSAKNTECTTAVKEIRMIEDTDHFLYRCKSCTANEESSVDAQAQNLVTDLEQRCVLSGESLNSIENKIADVSCLTIQDSGVAAQPEDKATTQMDCNPESTVSCTKPLPVRNRLWTMALRWI